MKRFLEGERLQKLRGNFQRTLLKASFFTLVTMPCDDLDVSIY